MGMIMKSSDFSLLYCLYPHNSIENIKNQIKDLLKKKWIACANILPPLTSIYMWDGEVQNETEVIVFFKTLVGRVGQVKDYLINNHSYDVPCVVHLNADVNREYLQYLKQHLN